MTPTQPKHGEPWVLHKCSATRNYFAAIPSPDAVPDGMKYLFELCGIGYRELSRLQRAIECVNTLAGIPDPEKAIPKLIEALKLAATRLEILTGRMRGCHEETGKHELLEEAEAFCLEARESLSLLTEPTQVRPAQRSGEGEG